jgi:carbon-monoxide dehydrogenase large subunit
MMKFGISQPVKRVEDARFLRGQGTYVEDMVWPGELRAVFVRAPMAHADIASIDTSAAQAAPGVHLVLTGADLDAAIDNSLGAVPIPQRDGSQCITPRRPLLASGRVRHVGEAVAAVIADTLEQARDAAELIEVDYTERAAVTSTAGALQPGAPLVHDEAAGNLCYDWAMGDEAATDAAFASAAHTVSLDLINNRVVANPMETRGVIASWADGRLHAATNGQGPWNVKKELAERLGLSPEQVRVTTPMWAAASA